MADYNRDFCLDPGIMIKQEPLADNIMINTSASVPIPVRRPLDISGVHDYSFDLESSQSPYQEVGSMDQIQGTPEGFSFIGNSTMWGPRLVGLEVDITKQDPMIHMDEDDIFQVDKADLIQGPTLAELNANDETLLGDLNFDDLLLPEENSYHYINTVNMSQPLSQKYLTPLVQVNNNTNLINNNSQTMQHSGAGFYRESFDPPLSVPSSLFENYVSKTPVSAFSPASQNSSTSSLLLNSTSSPPLPPATSPLQQKHSTLHELLMKREKYSGSPDKSLLGQSVPGHHSAAVMHSSGVRMHRSHNSRLSSSAPTHLGMDQIWQRREPRKHLLSTGSLAEAGSTSSLSTGGVLSPEAPDFSHDELDSDEESEHYEDFSSDNGDSDYEIDENGSRLSLSSSSKKERYFWQYNVQAKGPKGQRLVLKTKLEDPHVLNEVTDPVFSPSCAVRGIKHSGKARKGDGNDLTPNPRKLYNIGKELDKLSRIINDMTPVSEQPFNVRPKTRKEKNKLASRACRLKKKAQHEANKIKLHGLENEHKRLINGISQTKQIVATKVKEPVETQDELSKHIDKIVKSSTKLKIAGNTTEYVNKVIEKIKSGVPGGGLDDV